MPTRRRKVRLPKPDDDNFRERAELDNYLDSNYESYIGFVTNIYTDLKDRFGGPPEITILIREVSTSLYERDGKLFDHLTRHGYGGEQYKMKVNLFARVVVTEALPKIF